LTGKERDELVEALRARLANDQPYLDKSPSTYKNLTEMEDSRPGEEGRKVKRQAFTGGDIQALLYVLLLIGGVYVASLFLRIIVRLI
jgi:hypothetical protein